MRLMIDSVTVNSAGMRHLKNEIVLSLIEARRGNQEIILLQNERDRTFIDRDGLRVINLKKPGWYLLGRFWWYNWFLPKLMSTEKAEVFYSLSGFLGKNIARVCGTINTVNNMVPFDTTLRLKLKPLTPKWIVNKIRGRLYGTSSRIADMLIMHSNHALRFLQSNVGKKTNLAEKTAVVYTGAPRSLINRNAQSVFDKDYIFYGTTIYWYKNHLNLIAGYDLASEQHHTLPHLILAGYPMEPDYVEAIKNELDQLQNPKIHFMGAVSEVDLFALLSHAKFTIFPSTCETNSVVIAEMLTLNGVLACSEIEPMKEIAGSAALFFDPYSRRSIADAILKLDGDVDLREMLKLRAAKRVEDFSWDKVGPAVWSVAEEAKRRFSPKRERTL